MQLKNDIALIGDAINTIPAMQAMANSYGGIQVAAHPLSRWMYDFIPEKYGITLIDELTDDDFAVLSLMGAYRLSLKNDWHMSQAHFGFCGLPTPSHACKPDLNIPDIDVPVYDYLIAPFSRSLPADQKWDKLAWCELCDELEGKTIGLLGSSQYDEPFYPVELLMPHNLTVEFDRPMAEVLNLIMKCRKGVISVVTGISHLCFLSGSQNYLLCGQTDKWGINPEAKILQGKVCDFSVKQVLDLIDEK